MAVRTAAGHVGARSGRARVRLPGALIAVALGAAAAATRAGPLGPSSLWLDDAWSALVVRADSMAEAAGLTVTAPGFGLLLRAWLSAVGFSETAAQLPAFAFAVAGPPLLFLAAVGVGLRLVPAATAGLLLLAAPAHLTFATRVKQYSLDALLATGIIVLAWRVVDAPGDARRWYWLAGGAAAGTVLSAAVAPVAAAGFGAGLLAIWRQRTSARALPGVAVTGLYGLAGLVWYATVLRPSVSPALREYWAGHYVDVTSGPVTALRTLLEATGGVLTALSPLPPLLTGLILLGAAALAVVRRPAVGLLLLGPLLLGAVLAALRLAPLGGGRTDIVLLPGLAMLVALALDVVTGRDRRLGAGVAVALLALTAVVARPPGHYPAHDVRPLVAAMERQLAPGDAVLVYSATRWAYGLYTGFAVDFPDDPTTGTGFDVDVADPRVRVLDPQRARPHRYARDVAAATAGALRVWLLASGWQEDLAVLERLIAEEGLVEAERLTRPGGLLVRWER